MTSSAENSCFTKFDWFDIFPERIKFRVTSRIRIWRHYEKGLLYMLSPVKAEHVPAKNITCWILYYEALTKY